MIEHDILAHHKKRFGGAGRGNSNDLSLNNYFVNYSSNTIAPGSTPAKFYDMGNFQAVIDGCQAGKIGELWIEYRFTMIRRLQFTLPPPIPYTLHYVSDTSAATAAQPYLGATFNSSTFPADSVVSFTPTHFSITNVPVGNYLVETAWIDADQTINGTASTATTVFGCTQENYFVDGGAENVATEGTALLATGGRATYATVLQVSTLGTVTFGSSGPGGMGAADYDLIVTQLPSTFSVSTKLTAEDSRLEAKLTIQDAKIERLEKMLQALSPPSTPFECEPKKVRGFKPVKAEEQKDNLSAVIVPQSMSTSTVSLLTSFLKSQGK